MSWNYRIVRTRFKTEPASYRYAVHEVYYNDKNEPNAMTNNPTFPLGETITGFLMDFEAYASAFKRPVLVYEDNFFRLKSTNEANEIIKRSEE